MLVFAWLPLVAGAEPNEALVKAFQETKAQAESGNVDAQYQLAGMYAKGTGVAADQAEAVKWYRKVAEQNDRRGQSMLGVMYTNARGVPQDYTEAMKWFRKAAAQNSAHAQYNLGFMYANGKGVTQDDTESANWYRKAAEQNDANSQRILSEMYVAGRGVSKDLVQAHAWSQVYIANGNEAARPGLKKLEAEMTPEQIAAAAKRAGEITEKLPKPKKP